MTGPQHYQEAERLLALATTDDGLPYELSTAYLEAAHVHAVLALAAATALPTVTQLMGDSPTITEWGYATRASER